ncbi:uncharacterized protein LOC101847646 isoform X2 [Aplysia californica]|uniref:Uncharacterized protein LOC101847646 isoform X2 n=1 Tax=Aplysia californica TaxID=6500 RepID=A0ABM0ZXA6_APLCA|nr:uncharacterized protein LOC101847646 isoform X2 [Aplysia californica]
MTPMIPSCVKPLYRADAEPPVSLLLAGSPFAEPRCFGWDKHRVVEWLDEVGFARYKSCFLLRGVTGRTLVTLTADDLRRMGVLEQGHASRLAQEIECLNYMSRSGSPDKLPYPFHRALYFGEQSQLADQFDPDRNMCYLSWRVPDNRTLIRISSLSEDTTGWFERNRPHPLI